MKSAIKILAVSMIAFGLYGGVDSVANAQSKPAIEQFRGEIRDAIRSQIVAAEAEIDAINERLQNNDLPRDQERALIRERRALASMNRQLESRRQRARNWNSFQLAYFGNIFLPKDVSPS